MSDTETTPRPSEPALADQKDPKPSNDFVRETKPSTNIAIGQDPEPRIEDGGHNEEPPKTEAKIETIFKSRIEAKDSNVTTSPSPDRSPPKRKTHSNIFSGDESDNGTATIFSVKGAPSKRPREGFSIDNKPLKSIESTSRTEPKRNPLTGIGVISNDEYTVRPVRRRDGNPLLGVGYDNTDSKSVSSSTSQRVPPGGYSKGLW